MVITAKRARDIPPFIVMDVLEKAHALEKEGRHIIHLEIGEPDFPTPACICDAANKAIQDGHTHYTHSLGLIELREAICRHYLEKYGVNIKPDQIIITSGTSPALFMLFSTLLEHGEEIIISDPHYPCYPNFANFLKANPAPIIPFSPAPDSRLNTELSAQFITASILSCRALCLTTALSGTGTYL